MNISPTILNLVEQTKQFIQNDMSSKGLDDTGAASNSLRIEQSFSGITLSTKLIGAKYIEYLDRGSGIWEDPEKYISLGYILQSSGWAQRKGGNPYAAAYVIANEGSRIYKDRKNGIMLDEKIEVLTKEIEKDLTIELKKQIINQLKRK